VETSFDLVNVEPKNRILFQGQGDLEFQSAGILLYFEALKRESNTEIGTKDIFETASKKDDN
jgi:hypothetical protein